MDVSGGPDVTLALQLGWGLMGAGFLLLVWYVQARLASIAKAAKPTCRVRVVDAEGELTISGGVDEVAELVRLLLGEPEVTFTTCGRDYYLPTEYDGSGGAIASSAPPADEEATSVEDNVADATARTGAAE